MPRAPQGWADAAPADDLRSLVDDPERYVEHPSRLDLEWIADRLPDELASLLVR